MTAHLTQEGNIYADDSTQLPLPGWYWYKYQVLTFVLVVYQYLCTVPGKIEFMYNVLVPYLVVQSQIIMMML